MKGGVFRKNLAFFFLLVSLSLFLLFFEQKGWLGSTRVIIERPILAVEERIYSLNFSISQLLNYFKPKRDQDKEIMRLQGELRQLAVEGSQLSTCLEENQEMRRLLNAPLPPQWKFLPAKVVGKAEKMKLDKGRQDGVEEGMMVVSEDILVGKIISVSEASALVELPLDPGSKIPVVVKKAGNLGVQARGLLITQPGGELVLDRILQTDDVQSGDLVLTDGEAGWLPDILIGQIESVVGQEAAIYKQAQVSSLLDYQILRIVFIVIG